MPSPAASPSRYPPDLIDAVVQRVTDARAVKAYGAPTTLQPDKPATEPPAAYLPPGLLHCRHCQQPMSHTRSHDSEQGYQCQQGCRPRPLDGVAVADTVGRAILAHTPRLIPPTGTPTPPHLAATHAHRVIARLTVGATPGDVTLTWRATPVIEPDRFEAERAQRVATARKLALSDPLRARHLLHASLTGINPATAPAHPLHAHAATLLAELQLRLGHLTDAITWATYAHHSTTHLHGPTHQRSLHAHHILAAAHQRAGHHQRGYRLYRQLAEHLAKTDGTHAARTLAAHASTALALHALGHCQAAQTLLTDTITTHRREHPSHPATARMTQHLTRIRRDCAAKDHQHHDPQPPAIHPKATPIEQPHPAAGRPRSLDDAPPPPSQAT